MRILRNRRTLLAGILLLAAISITISLFLVSSASNKNIFYVNVEELSGHHNPRPIDEDTSIVYYGFHDGGTLTATIEVTEGIVETPSSDSPHITSNP